MELCRCGNTLGESNFRITVHPCRCDDPGPDRKAPPNLDLLSNVPERQYNQRKKVGLPLQTDVERAADITW